MMKKQALSYTDAFNELEQIVKKMEKADITVDELAANLSRASELIKICKDVLTKTEDEVHNIIEDL